MAEGEVKTLLVSHKVLTVVGKYDKTKIRNLGPIVNGEDPGRKSDDEIIMFVTGGMPLHDIAWGKTLYDRAVAKGLGTEYCFFDEAYWR